MNYHVIKTNVSKKQPRHSLFIVLTIENVSHFHGAIEVSFSSSSSLSCRHEGQLEVSWYVSSNEDIGDFRLELRTKGFPQTTLFQEDVTYNTRYVGTY